ncbi:TolC family protein [bacterium]|nr:TolC family protein [candidate division CSSED10-310 bacterium]
MCIIRKMIDRVLWVCVLLTCGLEPGLVQAEHDALSLSDAVDRVRAESTQMRNSELDLGLARSHFRLARAQYFPALTLSSDSMYSNPSNGGGTSDPESTIDHHFEASIDKRFQTTGGTLSVYSVVDRFDESIDPRYANTMGIRFDQPLLRELGPWGDRLTMAEARLVMENAEYEYEMQVRQLVLETITSFFYALKQVKLVEVAEKGVQDSERHMTYTQIKFEEGLVARMDVSQAELQLARQRTVLIRAQQTASAALDRLKVQLHLPLHTDLVLLTPTDPPTETLDADGIVREGLIARNEMQVLHNRIRAAEWAVSRAMNLRFPALDLLLEAEVAREESGMSDVFHVDDPGYSVSMGFSWTLGHCEDRERLVRERIELKKLQNTLENEILSMEQEIREEIRAYEALVETLAVSSRSVTVAEQALDLATRSYQEGLTSNLDLIRAQDDLIDARTRYFSDRMDLAVAKARIIYSMGRPIDPDRLVIGVTP